MLPGPLHGLANQEVLVWLTKLKEELGSEVTAEQMKDFLWKTLKGGQVNRIRRIHRVFSRDILNGGNIGVLAGGIFWKI